MLRWMKAAKWTKAFFFDNITDKICRSRRNPLERDKRSAMEYCVSEKDGLFTSLEPQKALFLQLTKATETQLFPYTDLFSSLILRTNYGMKFDTENGKQKKVFGKSLTWFLFLFAKRISLWWMGTFRQRLSKSFLAFVAILNAQIKSKVNSDRSVSKVGTKVLKYFCKLC